MLDNTHKNYAIGTKQTTEKRVNNQLTELTIHLLLPKNSNFKNAGTAAEQIRRNPGTRQILFLDSSNSCPADIQKSDKYIMTTIYGDNNVSSLTTTTPLKKAWWEKNRPIICFSR